MAGEGSLKVIFDEMFGVRWVRALEHLFVVLHKEPRPKFLHLFDIAAAGSPDDQWVPSLGEERIFCCQQEPTTLTCFTRRALSSASGLSLWTRGVTKPEVVFF